MIEKKNIYNDNEQLQKELEELRHQLYEANETIDAIRTGQIDAIVVQGNNGHQLYTLKSADHTYRKFIEKMTEGAVTLSQQGIILYCNSQFAAMVDKPLSKVIGVPFEYFVAQENKKNFNELFEESWKQDCKGEVMLYGRKMSTPVQLSLTTLELDEGISLSIILTDLTSHKRSQQQLSENNERLEIINQALETSNHDLQQFASVASHDLQEPLRKIQIFSHLMKEKETELTPALKKYLQKIIDSSGRMKKLIIDILNYSKLSANDLPVECVDLKELLDEILEDFELIIKEKNAKFYISSMPSIEVNRGQIRQVFQNIISNSLKFSANGKEPHITISSQRVRKKDFASEVDDVGTYFIISIQDNGIGFDEKYVSNIFALFERLNSKDRYEGTGIGLAIAKKIIDKHDGLITAISRENEGAEFLILLPQTQSYKKNGNGRHQNFIGRR